MLVHAYKNGIISTIIFLISTTSHSDSDQYLCEAKGTVGFKYVEEKNDWGISVFLNDKYIFSKCSDIDKKNYFIENCGYKLTKIGDKHPMCGCKDSEHSIICDNCGLSDFRFSKDTGRFINVYPIGYWNMDDKTSDTPYLQIGICTPF